MVVGSVGSGAHLPLHILFDITRLMLLCLGKSTFVNAVLGEIDQISGERYVHGSIAYVPQQAWIVNATLRNNILFGQEMDWAKYQHVLDACALRSDLEILRGGDLTEIGERGVNLSGGMFALSAWHVQFRYLTADCRSEAAYRHCARCVFAHRYCAVG